MILRGLLVVVAVLVFVCGFLWLQNGWLTADVESLEADNASLERSVQSLVADAAQSREAAAVAKANAERERELSAEFEAFRDQLRNGGNDDQLPCWFVIWFNDVLGRVPEQRCAD